MTPWSRWLRPGDWCVVLGALGLCLWTATASFRVGLASSAVVRRDGEVIAKLPLDRHARIGVTGALGETVIEVAPGRARVAADAGPRQLYVLQGWLTRPGAVAICAPSHLSLELEQLGASHDSVAY
ncbi:MAG TPA: NusG domain II-containing protein [Rhodocyclaceae bacterium]|nr:NusG domain II-containing protein [Rhodocyclaceae bacterium]